jgi:hypothetical protein
MFLHVQKDWRTNLFETLKYRSGKEQVPDLLKAKKFHLAEFFFLNAAT